MAYVKTVWADGDVITATKLNNLETGLETFEVSLTGYQPKGDYATVQDLTVYAPKSELAKYQPVGDYALKSEIPDLGQYVTKEELATDIQGLAQKSEIPTKLPNPNALTIKYNGVTAFTYDGSTAETGNFTVNAEVIAMGESEEQTVAAKIGELESKIAELEERLQTLESA